MVSLLSLSVLLLFTPSAFQGLSCAEVYVGYFFCWFVKWEHFKYRVCFEPLYWRGGRADWGSRVRQRPCDRKLFLSYLSAYFLFISVTSDVGPQHQYLYSRTGTPFAASAISRNRVRLTSTPDYQVRHQIPSFSLAICAPFTRFAIFLNAISRAKSGLPCFGFTSMLKGLKPQSSVAPS